MDNATEVKPVEESIFIDDVPEVKEQVTTEEASVEILIKDTTEHVHENDAIEKPTRKHHNAVLQTSINADEKLTTGDELVLPSNFDIETRRALEKMPNIDLLDSPDARQWANAVKEGLEYTTYGEAFVPTLEDDKAEFNHVNMHNGISLNAQSPKFKPAENQNLKGERAVIRLISHLGLGTLFQVPLWHSGLWITFKPPSESEIVELNRALIADKIQFGRYTYGLAFSNITSYTIDRLMDFVLTHVYDITAKAEDITIDNLRNHISCQDIPSLLWGFICSMYPKGFKYRRPCTNDPEKCNYILEETLNVTKLQWTNSNALTEWQKTFMSGRQAKNKDLASITRYKEELSQTQKKKIVINEGTNQAISFTLKTPNVTEYVDAGHRWISDIVNTVDKALGTDADIAERNNIIVKYGQASAMHQYSHWVDSIEYETNIIDDRETIERTLDVLSSDDTIRSKFVDSVIDYINKSTISIIGIPLFDCPKCGSTQTSTLNLPIYTNIIPLDVINVFTGLLIQRLSRLTSR